MLVSTVLVSTYAQVVLIHETLSRGYMQALSAPRQGPPHVSERPGHHLVAGSSVSHGSQGIPGPPWILLFEGRWPQQNLQNATAATP